MGREVERKFLVYNDKWRDSADSGVTVRQGYIAGSERASVRVRLSDDGAWINLKGATLGVERSEFEYPVPEADAREMLDTLCEWPLIEKTRYHVRHGAHVWEVDVFHGENEGLVVAEIELDAPDEAFERPPWIGREVSDQPRYYNVCLRQHPFSAWSAAEREGAVE